MGICDLDGYSYLPRSARSCSGEAKRGRSPGRQLQVAQIFKPLRRKALTFLSPSALQLCDDPAGSWEVIATFPHPSPHPSTGWRIRKDRFRRRYCPIHPQGMTVLPLISRSFPTWSWQLYTHTHPSVVAWEELATLYPMNNPLEVEQHRTSLIPP